MTRVGESPPALYGGALCLDFVNTVDPRHRLPREDFLEDYGAFVEWARYAGAVGSGEARKLLALAGRDPASAAKVQRRAITLREALYGLLRPARSARGSRPALEVVNRELRRALIRTALEPAGDGFTLDWAPGVELDRPLWPVVRSAAELLGSEGVRRIGECEGEGCGWLFLDTSTSGRRRWCSMAGCGNRAKAQRHRARLRTSPRV